MFALLVAAAALPAAAEADTATRQVPPPLRQQSTPGQDEQECGFLLLPEKVALAPSPPSVLERSGSWQTQDTATLASWSQPLLRWSPSAVYYFVGPKSFVKVEQEGPMKAFPGADVVSLRDCDDQLMYTLAVNRSEDTNYKIFNRAGELVAESHYSHHNGFYDGQLEFRDSFGQPIAIAHSPFIPEVGKPYQDVPSEEKVRRGFSGLSPWQVLFMDAYTTNSSLIIAQNRWVVTAVVQDLALRNAPAPSLRNWFLAVVFVPSAIVVMLICVALNAVYDVAYPPPRKSSEVTNPFLKDYRPYGALAPRGQAPLNSHRPDSLTGN